MSVTITGYGAAAPSVGTYQHVQNVASDTWTVDHNLGYRPGGIFVEDGDGEDWEPGSIEHPNLNRTVLTFSKPIAGTADLS